MIKLWKLKREHFLAKIPMANISKTSTLTSIFFLLFDSSINPLSIYTSIMESYFFWNWAANFLYLPFCQQYFKYEGDYEWKFIQGGSRVQKFQQNIKHFSFIKIFIYNTISCYFIIWYKNYPNKLIHLAPDDF